MGLFGYDLDYWYASCQLASLYCDSSFYSQYDGWALGAYFHLTQEWFTDDTSALVCLEQDS